MTSRGAGARSCQVLVSASIALAFAGGARAEGVEKREKVASSPARLRGAAVARPGERDGVADRGVQGFGERAGGGYWLHWGDHLLLLREGRPPLAFGVARYMKPRGEWAGADASTASPESVRLGVDVGAGREFVDVGFRAIEKGAREPR